MPRTIGIDLGTTNSAVAVLRDGAVQVLDNSLGEALTPSVVALDRGTDVLLTGRAAKELLALAPERAAATFKRGMGEDRTYVVGGRELGPVELSACILRALREDAERALGEAVEAAVITVPAYFSEEQRVATVKAGELAGLRVARILNEPTAAAMAYGLHEPELDSHFLVFDLGGGTFDVCVMERFAGVLQVKSTAGESHLGGEDFTRRLVGHVLNEVGLSYEQVELRAPEALGLLTRRCELAKRRLSDVDEVEVVVPSAAGTGLDERLPLTRAVAEENWAPLVQRLTAPCRAALRGARLRADELDEVILVGGATRMPGVRAFARELFRTEPTGRIDADLAVVHGAAIQAALCDRDAAVEDIVVTDVLSHSLGVSMSKQIGGKFVHGYFSPIIHRNTVIPTSRSETYETIHPNQTELQLDIYEGEARHAEQNHKIGELTVKGVPKSTAGQQVEVRFTYDVNGILEVNATIVETGQSFTTILTRDARSLGDKELARARERLEKLRRDPREDAATRDLLLRAESLWSELPPEVRPHLEQAMDVFEASMETRNPDEIRKTRRALRDFCDRLDGGERW